MSRQFNIVQNDSKELPNNIEAEQSVIGSVLVSNEIFDADYAVLTDELDAHLVDVPQQSGSINPSDDADSLEDTIDTLLDSSDVVDNDPFDSKNRIKTDQELYFDELEEDNYLVEKNKRIEKILEDA